MAAEKKPLVCAKCFRTEDKFKKPFIQHPEIPSLALCPLCQGNCFACGKPIAKDKFHCPNCIERTNKQTDKSLHGEPRFSGGAGRQAAYDGDDDE